METPKTANLPATSQQLSLTFETEVIRRLSTPERRAVMMALIEFLIEASGLEKGKHPAGTVLRWR